MTAADEHYMVDVDDENLLDFLAWYRDALHRGLFRDMTTYSLIKMTWMAAKNGPPPVAQQLEPLPKMPTDKTRAFARAYGMAPESVRPFPQPDFVQHGTVTGRIPRQDPDPFAAVRLSGPQQAALDSLYPVAGTNLADPNLVLDDLPVVGPVEDR